MSEIETTKTAADDAATTKTTTKTKAAKVAAPTFGKAQLLSSSQFSRADKYFLEAILDDDRQYTLDEAQRLLGAEMERTVE